MTSKEEDMEEKVESKLSKVEERADQSMRLRIRQVEDEGRRVEEGISREQGDVL